MNDYNEFKDETPKDGALAQVAALVEAARAAEAECEMHATSLKSAQERLRDIVSRQLPELLDSLGLEEFKTKDGLKVTINEDIQAGIPEARRSAAHKWLEDNGHAGLIKRDITVSFNKDQQQIANELMTRLAAEYAAVTQNQKVHPSTLKAFVKEMLRDGKEVPDDLFGIFRQRVARFTAVAKKR